MSGALRNKAARAGAALLAGILPAAGPASAQTLSYEDVSDPALDTPEPAVPYEIRSEASAVENARPPEQTGTSSDGPKLQYALLDRFEWTPKGDSYAWDFSALLGDDSDRVYFGFSGDGSFAGQLDTLELDAFYSRNVGGNLDLNAGLRYDARPGPSRVHGALGAQYDDGKLWLGTWAYLSTRGELSARLAGYYNLKLVKRLVLQPSLELDAYASDVPALGIGRGFSYAEGGLRIRYEIVEHLAPYFGFSWSRDLGRTARLDRAAGVDPEAKNLVLGVRSEF
jgi:copper resistance protein B